MSKKISILIIVLISLSILLGLSRQIGDALGIGRRVDEVASEVSKLQERNKKLHNDLKNVEHYTYIEEVARNKLNLAKNGETIVVIPETTINQFLAAQTPYTPDPIPNWEGWMRLFFH